MKLDRIKKANLIKQEFARQEQERAAKAQQVTMPSTPPSTPPDAFQSASVIKAKKNFHWHMGIVYSFCLVLLIAALGQGIPLAANVFNFSSADFGQYALISAGLLILGSIGWALLRPH